MAQVGLKRQLAPGLHISSVLRISQLGEPETSERTKALALLAAAIFTFTRRCHCAGFSMTIRTAVCSGGFLSDFRLPEANVQPPRFALRVCEKCVSTSGISGCMSSAAGITGITGITGMVHFRLAAQLETATIRRECSNRQPRWQRRFLGARFRRRKLR